MRVQPRPFNCWCDALNKALDAKGSHIGALTDVWVEIKVYWSHVWIVCRVKPMLLTANTMFHFKTAIQEKSKGSQRKQRLWPGHVGGYLQCYQVRRTAQLPWCVSICYQQPDLSLISVLILVQDILLKMPITLLHSPHLKAKGWFCSSACSV